MARAHGGAPPPVHRSRQRGRAHRRPHPRRGRPSRPRRTGVEGSMSEAVTRIQVGGTAGTDPYEVLVGRQLLGELGGLIGDRAKRVAVVHPEARARNRA
ncbi:3-dehydroquinate synthase, partial [Streptomyces sp. NPDC059466]